MWKRRVAIIIAAAMLTVMSAVGAAASQAGKGAEEALSYIKSRQNADGGFSEPDAASDPRTSCWAVLSGAAVGEDPLSWSNSGSTAEQYLDAAVGSVSSLEDIELMALAIAESGGDPTDVSGKNLVSLIKAQMDSSGKIGADIYQHCWGIIAIIASGEDAPSAATEWLVEKQRVDGGWGESDQVVVKDTALALEALNGAGESSGVKVDSALQLLHDKMDGDGGYMSTSKKSDAQTTSTVLRAIYAAGEDPKSDSWSFHGNNPLGFLNSLQASDGHFQYSKGTESQPAMTTAIALPSISGVSFPLNSSNTLKSGTDINSSGDPDTGTAGAGMSLPATKATVGGGPGLQARVVQGAATGASACVLGALGLWLFLILCFVYAGLLIIIAFTVAAVSKPKKSLPPFPPF